MIKNKKKKALLVFILVLFVTLISILIIWQNVSRIHFRWDNNITSVVVSGQDKNEMKNNGFVINFPSFHNITSWTFNKDYVVYDKINGDCQLYAMDISAQFNNYAKLNYTVDVKENEMLVITFFGSGYPDDGKGEPVAIDKTFIYDISNVSPSNLPKLIPE